MKTTMVVTLVAMAAITVGCAAKIKVTYHADPEAAVLYANQAGTRHGLTPVTLYYEMTDGFRTGKECLSIDTVRVRWPSGAEAVLEGGTRVCPKNGLNQEFTFVRPDDVPGRELDVQYALELLRIAALQEQARREARSRLLSTLLAAPARQRQTCVSEIVDNVIYTRCR